MNTKRKAHEQMLTIPGFCCDFTGKLKLPVLLQYWQELSLLDNPEGPLSPRALREAKLAWMLESYDLSCVLLPSKAEEVRLVTWPMEREGLYFLRGFALFDTAGTCLASSVSRWVLVDLVERKAQRPRPEWIPDLVEEPGGLVLPGRNRQLKRLNASGPILWEQELKPRYSELDQNQHVNNTFYLGWALDLLAENAGTYFTVKRADLLFRREILLEDRIILRAYELETQDPGEQSLLVIGEKNSLEAFRIQLLLSRTDETGQ